MVVGRQTPQLICAGRHQHHCMPVHSPTPQPINQLCRCAVWRLVDWRDCDRAADGGGWTSNSAADVCRPSPTPLHNKFSGHEILFIFLPITMNLQNYLVYTCGGKREVWHLHLATNILFKLLTSQSARNLYVTLASNDHHTKKPVHMWQTHIQRGRQTNRGLCEKCRADVDNSWCSVILGT